MQADNTGFEEALESEQLVDPCSESFETHLSIALIETHRGFQILMTLIEETNEILGNPVAYAYPIDLLGEPDVEDLLDDLLSFVFDTSEIKPEYRDQHREMILGAVRQEVERVLVSNTSTVEFEHDPEGDPEDGSDY